MSILGTVGIADKGDYNANTTYVEGNSVYYGGSTWVALKNNITGITPEEGENWKYLARGFGSDSLSQIEGTDTSGVLGTAGASVISQALIDAIADKVMTKLIPYANIANNFMATDPKTVLSGPMGKSLKDQFDQLNSNLVGTVTVSVGTNSGSYLIKKGIGICTLQLSVIIPEGFTSWNDQKIATVSFLPQNGAMRNINLFSTGTGNSIKGRININGSGDVYLYITDLIPSGGVTIQETITYIAK